MNTLRTLLKAKARENSDLNDLISRFIEEQGSTAKKQTGAFLDALLVDIARNLEGKVERAVILEIVRDKIDLELGVKLDLAGLEDIYTKTANAFLASTPSRVQASFVFNRLDTESLSAIRKGFVWMQGEHSKEVQEALKDKIEKAFRGEVARVELPAQLREEFGHLVRKETSYFKGVSDHIISQGQNLARITQGQKYGVKHYRVKARMDNRTTAICRSMNGRIIPAGHLEAQAGKIAGAKDLESKKAAAEWRDAAFLKKDLPASLGMPPYHFRCRTILQPVWLREEEVEVRGEKIKVTNTGQFPTGKNGVEFSHVDAIGVERQVTTETFNHDSGSVKPGAGKMRAALNSINRIAPHAEIPGRVVATSANGYFMAFDGERVVTMFKPDSHAEKYFKKSAVREQQEVIKWKDGFFTSGSIGTIIGKLLKRNT